MSLFTALPTSRRHEHRTPAAAPVDPSRFEKLGETSLYVTNTRAGEVAAKFVQLFGKDFLKKTGIAEGEAADQIVRQTAEALPLLGWSAAVAAEHRRPLQEGLNDSGEMTPIARDTGRKTPVLNEPVLELIYEPESDAMYDFRVARHEKENRVSGAAAAMIMGSMAIGLEQQHSSRGRLVSPLEMSRAHDMLAAGQPESADSAHFHYTLV